MLLETRHGKQTTGNPPAHIASAHAPRKQQRDDTPEAEEPKTLHVVSWHQLTVRAGLGSQNHNDNSIRPRRSQAARFKTDGDQSNDVARSRCGVRDRLSLTPLRLRVMQIDLPGSTEILIVPSTSEGPDFGKIFPAGCGCSRGASSKPDTAPANAFLLGSQAQQSG